MHLNLNILTVVEKNDFLACVCIPWFRPVFFILAPESFVDCCKHFQLTGKKETEGGREAEEWVVWLPD